VRHIVPRLFLAVLLAVVAGCSSTPKPSGFLVRYSDLEPVKKPNLDGVAEAAGFSPRQYRAVVLAPVRVSASIRNRIAQSDKFGEYLRRCLHAHLVEKHVFPIVTENPNFLTLGKYGPSTLRFDLAITEIRYGNGLLRYLIGWDSAGATIVQVEGKLSDVRTGELMLKFADRRRNSGYPGLGFNFKQLKKVFRGSYLVSASLYQISSDVAEWLKQQRQPAATTKRAAVTHRSQTKCP